MALLYKPNKLKSTLHKIKFFCCSSQEENIQTNKMIMREVSHWIIFVVSSPFSSTPKGHSTGRRFDFEHVIQKHKRVATAFCLRLAS